MDTKQLIKTTKLGRNEIRDIQKLIQLAARVDNFSTKVYWNILKDRKIPEFDDFFFYINGNIVGYLGIFLFKADKAEISAVIHPKFRKQGIFTRLFEEARRELKRRGIPTALMLCEKDAQPAEDLIQKLGCELSHAEIEMIFKRKVELAGLPEVIMRDVTDDDVMELARMDTACFGSNFEKMVYRFVNGIKEKDRVIWMAVLDGKDVGKLHIRFDEGRKGFIHDLCVPPENQRKRIASSMVMASMERLKTKGINFVYLDVEEKNVTAIALYEKCGFDISAYHRFWSLTIDPDKPE